MSARDELTTLILGKTAPRAADAILAAGYSKPRTITTIEDLDGLPAGTLVRAVSARSPKFGDIFERFLSGWLHLDPGDRDDGESTLKGAEVLKWYGDLSATVLYEPTA